MNGNPGVPGASPFPTVSHQIRCWLPHAKKCLAGKHKHHVPAPTMMIPPSFSNDVEMQKIQHEFHSIVREASIRAHSPRRSEEEARKMFLEIIVPVFHVLADRAEEIEKRQQPPV